MVQELLSSSQAADYLGVTRQRVDQLGSAGIIPRERMGFFWVYQKKDLDQWNVAENRTTGRPKVESEGVEINKEPEYVAA